MNVAVEGGERALLRARARREPPHDREQQRGPWPEFPEVPTLKEQGFDTATRQPIIWAGPAGMPREIRERLRGALMAAANDPEVQARQTAASIAIRVLDDVATRSLIAEMRPGVEGALTAAGMSRRG